MSAAFIWILLPVLVAPVIFTLRRLYRLSVLLGSTFALVLALLAWLLPLDQEIYIGSIALQVNSVQIVFGRYFTLSNSDRSLLAVIYAVVTFWFFAVYLARAGRMTVPLGLVVVALLTAALAVEPFLYAGLLIGLAVLVCIPLLAAPGQAIGQGVLRFLTFAVLGVPVILFIGWMLTGVEARPGDVDLVRRSSALLGIGFMLLMGIFPFHTWVLMLTEEAHPYSAAFVLFMFPWMVSLFGFGFLDRFAWLRNAEQVYLYLRLAGVMMTVVAGFWIAFERHLGRQLGFAMLVETGFSLVAASLPGGIALHFEMILPRAVSLAAWALGLAALKPRVSGFLYRQVHGIGRAYPVATAALVLAQLSVAGLPLLAGFPVRLEIWDGLARIDPQAALLTLLASVGMMVAALRTLTVLTTGTEETPWELQEPRPVILLLVLAILALLMVGLFPQIFLPLLLDSLNAFPQLVP